MRDVLAGRREGGCAVTGSNLWPGDGAERASRALSAAARGGAGWPVKSIVFNRKGVCPDSGRRYEALVERSWPDGELTHVELSRTWIDDANT